MSSVPSSFSHPGAPPLHPELPEGATPPAEPPLRGPRDLGVPVWAPFAAAFAALVGMTLIQFLLLAGIDVFGGDTDAFVDSSAAGIVLTAVFDVLLVACSIAIVWRLTGRPSPAKFALRPAPVLRSVAWILGTFVAVWIAGAIIQLAFGKPEDQEIVTELRDANSVVAVVGFGLMTCVLAPLAEEFFFRGFLFRALAERLNLAWGVVLGGGIFGLVHLPGGSIEGVIVLGTLGAMLCLMLYYTASLLPCIIMHASFNSLAFGATKELPWWGYLLVLAGSVTTTLAIALLVTRIGRRTAPPGGLVPA
jgi:membrane protease YdiL (CAAX protease family)